MGIAGCLTSACRRANYSYPKSYLCIHLTGGSGAERVVLHAAVAREVVAASGLVAEALLGDSVYQLTDAILLRFAALLPRLRAREDASKSFPLHRLGRGATDPAEHLEQVWLSDGDLLGRVVGDRVQWRMRAFTSQPVPALFVTALNR
jgi:hypothetical protein